jgi:hypothetical protein
LKISIKFSLSNNGDDVKDKSLFFLAAITAPEKPIHKVRCCTITDEAIIPVPLKTLATTSIDGNTTNKNEIANVKYFSNLFI